MPYYRQSWFLSTTSIVRPKHIEHLAMIKQVAPTFIRYNNECFRPHCG